MAWHCERMPERYIDLSYLMFANNNSILFWTVMIYVSWNDSKSETLISEATTPKPTTPTPTAEKPIIESPSGRI